MNRYFYEISQQDYHKGKAQGPKCLIGKEFKQENEVYDAKVSYAQGRYYLSFLATKKIYKGDT
jgi:hypothetical protein